MKTVDCIAICVSGGLPIRLFLLRGGAAPTLAREGEGGAGGRRGAGGGQPRPGVARAHRLLGPRVPPLPIQHDQSTALVLTTKILRLLNFL